MAADNRQSLGQLGEDAACAALERLGYAILDRRYRTRHGEIDIVARIDETLVFVEVKARANDVYGGASVAVTPYKQRRIVRVAEEYLLRRRLMDEPCRFDVVTVEVGERPPRVVVYPHAFTA